VTCGSGKVRSLASGDDVLTTCPDRQNLKEVPERSPQKSGDQTTTNFGDLLDEGNRVDAVEAATNCETIGRYSSQHEAMVS
jgi:hypothetical protein